MFGSWPKKACLILLAVAVAFLWLPVGADAAFSGTFWAYDPADYVHSFTVDGDTRTVLYLFDDINAMVYVNDGVEDYNIRTEDEFVFNPRADSTSAAVNLYYLGEFFYAINGAPSGGTIDVSDIMPGAKLTFDMQYRYRVTFYEPPDGTVNIYFRPCLACFGYDGTLKENLYGDTNTVTAEVAGDTVSGVYHTETFTLPDGCVYVAPYIQSTLNYPLDSEGTLEIGIQPWDFKMSCDINMLYEESETLKQIDDKLGRMEGTLEEIAGAADKEKNEASSSGDDNVGALAGAIPDKSEGFLTAMGNLVSAMSYDGVDAKLTVPAIVMPTIPGVMDSYRLTEGWVIDFGEWFEKFPADIMEVVRVVLTLGLVVYCFKELYDTIAYALTLRGGDQ